jgi:hypothetical protein
MLRGAASWNNPVRRTSSTSSLDCCDAADAVIICPQTQEDEKGIGVDGHDNRFIKEPT